jgi:hypothetical protein
VDTNRFLAPVFSLKWTKLALHVHCKETAERCVKCLSKTMDHGDHVPTIFSFLFQLLSPNSGLLYEFATYLQSSHSFPIYLEKA